MTSQSAPTSLLHRRAFWKWCLVLGIVLLILGIAGAGATTLLEFSSVLIFGPLLLASSILQFIVAIAAEQRTQKMMHLAAAAVEMVLGFLIMAHPLMSALDLVIAIAVFLTIAGLLRLAQALSAQAKARGWILLTGAIAVLLGISIWTGWPSASLWFVGLCIAIDLISHGVSWLAIALAERPSASSVSV
jgi:uncharacterized membrane protein HdeD (DUF308 family)